MAEDTQNGSERPASLPSSGTTPSSGEAQLTPDPEPVITERVDWMIYDPETDGYLFSGDRVDCERWMQRLWKSRPTAVLIRENVRTRCQAWRSDRRVVPWVAPCSWIAQADENGQKIGDAWCTTHKHKEDTPVPPEFVRGAATSGTSVMGCNDV